MAEINDGGPAFPVLDPRELNPHAGMTLRDYFAGKAIQGFCANHAHAVLDGPGEFDSAAKEAYEVADAMLRARGQQ